MYKFLLMTLAFCLLHGYSSSSVTDEELKELRKSMMIPVLKPSPGRTLKNIMQKIKDHCTCAKLKCECCAELKYNIFDIEGCAHVAFNVTAKELSVQGNVAGQKMFGLQIPVTMMENRCFNLGREKLSACVTANLKDYSENEFTSCLTIDFHYTNVVFLSANFYCFEYSHGKFNFIQDKSVKQNDAYIDVKIKTPAELVVKIMEDFMKTLG